MPHALLGLLILLTLGALDLSLLTAPSYAVQQLRLAAKDSLSVSSFVLRDTNTLSAVEVRGVPSFKPESNVVEVVYQSPDRILESVTSTASGQSVSVLWIGSTRYERTNPAGKWIAFKANALAAKRSVDDVLFPIQSVAGATAVSRHGPIYSFVPGQYQESVLRLLGRPPTVLSSANFSAQIQGEFLSSEEISAVGGDQRLAVDLEFSSFDHAPALDAPPPSEVAVAPGLGGRAPG